MKSLYETQVELELQMKTIGCEKFFRNEERAMKAGKASTSTYNKSLTKGALPQLIEIIAAHVTHYAATKRTKTTQHLEFVTKVGVEKVAYVALTSVIDLVNADKTPLATLQHKAGQRLVDEYNYSNLAVMAPAYVDKIQKGLAQRGSRSYSHAQGVFNHAIKGALAFQQSLETVDIEKEAARAELLNSEYPVEFLVKLGSFMLDAVCSLSFQGEPLFNKTVTTRQNKTCIELEPSESIDEFLTQHVNEIASTAVEYSPCVIPPMPWTSPFTGGYHVEAVANTVTLIKTSPKHQTFNTYEQCPETYDAINKLQTVPMRINTSVLQVLEFAMKHKLELGIPCCEKYEPRTCPVPEEFSELKGKELLAVLDEQQQTDFKDWKKEAAEVHTRNKKRTAELLKINNLIKQGRKYAEFEELYFVYSLDYRQRVNVCSTYITTQGDDRTKALLQFAKAKKLGRVGAFWHVVQGAGVYNPKVNGVALDKMKFKDRVRFMLQPELVEQFLMIADDPYNNTGWLKADKPWGFLAWCFDFADMANHVEAGLPLADFETRLAVSQDGSCSGTQHYSMALRDKETAASVNLTKRETPNDIYNTSAIKFKECILNKLQSLKTVEADEETTKEIECLTLWLNHCNRNLAKLPTMTFVYSATIQSCRKTTKDYLLGLEEKEARIAKAEGRPYQNPHGFENVDYAAKIGCAVLWEAVGYVQNATKRGMNYMKRAARLCANENKAFHIVAPTGFVMRQAIYKMKGVRVKTQLLGEVSVQLQKETSEINPYSMATSAAPNGIHLMDASHLIKVCDAFITQDTHLIVIHDSFATHPCDVPKLRRTLTTTLIEMYDNYCLFDAVKESQKQIANVYLDEKNNPTPEFGDLELVDVKKARYAFG